MNKGGTVEAAGIRFTMIHADHTGGATLNTGSEQVTRDFGCWGWVIEFEDGTTVYHSGDTDLFGDMNLVRERFEPEIAVLPIGGHYTMGPRDAGRALELIGASTVIPVHYGTFPILAGTPEELEQHTSDGGRRARARRDVGGTAIAWHGMVVTPHPLATAAGVEALRAGGTAVDAAVAANAMLAVVYCNACGLGGDAFALVWEPGEGRLHGFNGSGRSPAALTIDRSAPPATRRCRSAGR